MVVQVVFGYGIGNFFISGVFCIFQLVQGQVVGECLGFQYIVEVVFFFVGGYDFNGIVEGDVIFLDDLDVFKFGYYIQCVVKNIVSRDRIQVGGNNDGWLRFIVFWFQVGVYIICIIYLYFQVVVFEIFYQLQLGFLIWIGKVLMVDIFVFFVKFKFG